MTPVQPYSEFMWFTWFPQPLSPSTKKKLVSAQPNFAKLFSLPSIAPPRPHRLRRHAQRLSASFHPPIISGSMPGFPRHGTIPRERSLAFQGASVSKAQLWRDSPAIASNSRSAPAPAITPRANGHHDSADLSQIGIKMNIARSIFLR